MAHSTLMSNDTATLGPLQSFRCTRYGLTCDVGGATSDAMNEVGTKEQCHSNESSPYLMPIGPYAQFFRGLKTSPNDVMFGALVGAPSPVTVELRTPPGSSTAVPALAHSCSVSGPNGPELADPAVRIVELANLFERGAVASVCDSNLAPALVELARHVRGLAGDSCLTRAIALPADCIVHDEVGASSTELPACDGGATNKPCYELVTDEASCTGGSHLRLEVERDAEPPLETVTVAACRI